MKRENKLNTRQWAFYNFLKRQALKDETEWLTKYEINWWVDGYELNTSETAHDECSLMNNDRIAINNSGEVDKLILVKDNKFKIATYEEAIEMSKDLYNQALKLLNRMSIINSKIKRDGQGKLLSNQLNPIDEDSKARLWYETFMVEESEK